MSWQTITKENNLAISVINFSDLIGRIDAEYYEPIYIENIKKITSKKWEPLKKLSIKITDFGAYSQNSWVEYLEEGKHIFIRNQDVEGFFIKTGDSIFISEDVYKKLSLHLEELDILVQRAGTLGKASIVLKDDLPSTANQNLAQIKIDQKLISPFYVIAFLNSHFGISSFERLATGNVQPWLNLEQISNLPIPIPNEALQDKVSELILSAKKVKDGAIKSYNEAEQMLLKEINLEGYKGTDEAISVRNFSEALADNRFDAEYWQPKYDEIEERVSKVQQEKLGDIVSVKKGVEVGSEAYADEGKDFIRVSDFTTYGIEDVEKKISEELYEELKENYKPKRGEVLFTKDGTIGISLALNEDVNAIVSSAFLRLKPKVKINNNYLALVLNSFYCKAQIERMSGGAVIAHLKPESAIQIKVPMLLEKKQEELANKVLEALRLRKEAKELLEKAKRAVEIFVEKDESSAISFLAHQTCFLNEAVI